MVGRVLVAIDDSPGALAAAQVAVRLTAGWGARLRCVHVVRDGVLAAAIDEIRPDGGAEERLSAVSASVLGYARRLGTEAGVVVETAQLLGEPFRAILQEARDWGAEVIVMGRSDRRGPGSNYVGSVTEHVLEFATCPVLVVPS